MGLNFCPWRASNIKKSLSTISMKRIVMLSAVALLMSSAAMAQTKEVAHVIGSYGSDQRGEDW